MSNELFGEVVKTISLDFAQKTSPVTVYAKQGDNLTRIIHIQPLMNGVPMNIDRSFQYVSKFAAKKPDGHYVYNDSAKINDDGTITVTLTDQTLAAHGNATCCIILESQRGDVLTSQNFTLIIEYSAGSYKNLASSDEIMGLDDKLAQVQAMIDRLNREGQTIPPINPEDANKVLTANEDGTAEWKEPTGGNTDELEQRVVSLEQSAEESEQAIEDINNNISDIKKTVDQHGRTFDNFNDRLDDTQEEINDLYKKVANAGGAKSWNDLSDKPFCDETVTIEWDGNTEGKTTIALEDGILYVKVSDSTPEPSDLLGGSVIFDMYNEVKTCTITEDTIMDARSDGMPLVVVNFSPYEGIAVGVSIIYAPIPEMGFNEVGVYFVHAENFVSVQSLTYNSIKKLDPKYLPEGGVGYDEVENIGDTLTWDGTPTEVFVSFDYTKFYKVSNNTPTLNELNTGTIAFVIDGEAGQVAMKNRVQQTSESLIASDLLFVAFEDGAEYEGHVFPEKGVYFMRTVDGSSCSKSIQIPNYNFAKSVTHKINPKYLPEGGIGYEESYTGEITIEWDGDPTGKPIIDTGEEMLIVKISDYTPEPSELLGGTAIIDGETYTITEDFIFDGRNEGIPALMVADGFTVFYEAFPAYGITETGSYVVAEMPRASLTYTGAAKKIHKIDLKFLEFSKTSEIALVDETVFPGGVFTTPFVLVIGKVYLVVYDGVQYSCVAKNYDGITYVGNIGYLSAEDTGEPFIIAFVEGNNVLVSESGEHSVKIYQIDCVKIPKECLPDDIGGGLPEVTEDDNGNGLVVEDGKLVVGEVKDNAARQSIEDIEADIRRIDDEIPRATIVDDGKILQVVGGKYALVYLRDLGKDGM